MERNGMDRDLVCVLFPGIVKNEEKALQCLGGIRCISQIYSNPNKRRLGMSFQPENPYVKKIYADCHKTAGVLLKVKVKKIKSENAVEKKVVSTAVVGRVTKIYKFESMCDFQYLPVDRESAAGQPQCILEQILPSGTDHYDFMLQPAPYYIVPANFTRSDKPTSYSYTDKRYGRGDSPDGKDRDVHHRVRSERSVPSSRYDFKLTDDQPSEPHEYYIRRKAAKVKVYPHLENEFQAVKKHFEERPIWSMNLLKYHTKIRTSTMKIILPCLAFYMKSGPWRMQWVRFGYDVRKDPGSRIYQTLDFRLRHQAGVHSMVMTRDQVVHYKKADRVRHLKRRSEDPPPEDISEGAVYFRPGMAPTQRQIFYQYCDVQLPEVQAILAAEPPPGSLCHPKRGWLPADTDQVCRDHIFRYVKETLLASHSADLKLEQGSSDDGSNSDDDDSSTSDEAEVSNTLS